MSDFVRHVIAAIQEPDAEAMRRAAERHSQLTKPAGSLGRLESLAVQLAGITGSDQPRLGSARVVVMAADHGVTVEGVSAYPSSVTVQMVRNFLAGRAAINAIARTVGAQVVVVDMGTFEIASDDERLLRKRIGPGTANLALGPAMTRHQALAAIEAGIEIAELLGNPSDVFCAGEMGIGNTTAASAVVAALTRRTAASVTGRGTGIDDDVLERKIRVIEAALLVNRPNPRDPVDVLAKVGGFEIGGLAGLMLGAARLHMPVLVDGLISGAAALVAARMCPVARGYLIGGHQSVEPGHRVALGALGLEAILDLRLRLGEGTGAALAVPILRSAAETLSSMATFAEASVDESRVS